MAIGPFLSATQIPIEGVAVASGASTTSVWVPATSAIATNIWIAMTSAGTPTLTVTADVTIFDVIAGVNGTQTVTGPSGITANYIADIAVGTSATVGGWKHLDAPTELDYPYRWIRFKAAAADADATAVWLAICHNGL